MALSDDEVKNLTAEELQNHLNILRKQVASRQGFAILLLMACGFGISFPLEVFNKYPFVLVLLPVAAVCLYFGIALYRRISKVLRPQIWKIQSELDQRAGDRKF